MSNKLRYDLADQRLTYKGLKNSEPFCKDRVWEFNHIHSAVLKHYDLTLVGCTEVTLADRLNNHSNLGVFRNRQLRHSIMLSAALSSIAVSLHGRGAIKQFPEDQVTKKTQRQTQKRQ